MQLNEWIIKSGKPRLGLRSVKVFPALTVGAKEPRRRSLPLPGHQLTAVVRAPPLDAHVELVAHSHVHGQCHAGLLHVLGVPDPQLTERLWRDLGTRIRQCCLPGFPTSRGPALLSPAWGRQWASNRHPIWSQIRPLGSSPRSAAPFLAIPSQEGPPTLNPGGTYKAVAGAEGAVGHHANAGRAVSRGTAVWAEAGLAHGGQGTGHLPAVQKGNRVLVLAHHRTILQGEVIGCVPITDT